MIFKIMENCIGRISTCDVHIVWSNPLKRKNQYIYEAMFFWHKGSNYGTVMVAMVTVHPPGPCGTEVGGPGRFMRNTVRHLAEGPDLGQRDSDFVVRFLSQIIPDLMIGQFFGGYIGMLTRLCPAAMSWFMNLFNCT